MPTCILTKLTHFPRTYLGTHGIWWGAGGRQAAFYGHGRYASKNPAPMRSATQSGALDIFSRAFHASGSDVLLLPHAFADSAVWWEFSWKISEKTCKSRPESAAQVAKCKMHTWCTTAVSAARENGTGLNHGRATELKAVSELHPILGLPYLNKLTIDLQYFVLQII